MTIQKYLHQYIGVASLTAVVDHLDTAAEGSNAVISPTISLQRVKISCMQTIAIKLHQTSQRHDDIGMGKAQVHQRVITAHHTVAHVDHIPQDTPLQVSLVAAVQRTATVVDIVPGVLLAPVAVDLLWGEDVVECHQSSEIGMLNVTSEDIKLFAKGGSVYIGDDVVLVVEE